MREVRCPSCKKLLFKAEVVGKVEIVCRNNKCKYHTKAILFDFYPHIKTIIDIAGSRVVG